MKDPIYQKYFQAEKYLNEELIRSETPDGPPPWSRREWMLRFLDDLGHPEQAYPSIHIAGTSGKGSVALMIAEGLHKTGRRIGLHTTPYLQVATEKLWVDGKYASAGEFIELVEWIRPTCERWRSPEVPLHGMASFGICLEYFRRQMIDIAVMETGVGGRDDLTNILKTQLSVITPIGIDHVKTLGETIESIAEHKAGIIQEGVPVVAWRGAGSNVIERVAQSKGSPLTWVESTTNHFIDINRSIANAALQQMKHPVPDPECFISLPGRMEVVQEDPTIILDGAHNAQKLEALFKTILPIPERDPVLVFGMLRSKLQPEILELLRNYEGPIILTAPEVYGKEALPPAELARAIEKDGIVVTSSHKEAIEKAITLATANGSILVTGSLYLVGNIREIFYPRAKVLKKRTSWPR